MINQRIIFFDLDGTLHKQDIWRSFLFFLAKRLPLNVPLVFLLSPIILFGFAIQGWVTRWPMSLLLWGLTVSRCKKHLEQLEKQFIAIFRQEITFYPQVITQLKNYLQQENIQIWLITGSPESLVAKIYQDTSFFSKITLLGSKIQRFCGGQILTVRCIAQEKVNQLKQHLGEPLVIDAGYSDSPYDDPLLAYCKKRFRITHEGHIKTLS